MEKNTFLGKAGIWLKHNIENATFAQLPTCEKLIQQWAIMHKPTDEQREVIMTTFHNKANQLGVFPIIQINFN